MSENHSTNGDPHDETPVEYDFISGTDAANAPGDSGSTLSDGSGQNLSEAEDDVIAEAELLEEGAAIEDDRVTQAEEKLAERTADLQRLQAEYQNYKRRVDRDRAQAKQQGIESVMTSLLPVLDSVHLAESHGELTGAFKMVADELHKVTSNAGLVAYGEVGDPFDPAHHEALMNVPMEGVTVTTCSQVMQQGYMLNDKVLRPARVAVSEPTATADDSSGEGDSTE